MTNYVHHVAGRIRYKLTGLTHDEIRALGRALERCSDVEHVDVRPTSSSLVIHYDPKHTNIRRLGSCVQASLQAISTIPSEVRPGRQASDLPLVRNEYLARSVRHMGMVFGQTAFKVALEQAVRGSLNSLYRTVVARG